MIIRDATAADAAAISSLAEASFCATFAHCYPASDLATFLASWNPVEKVAAHIAGGDYAYHIAQSVDGALLGYIKIGPVEFALPESEPPAADNIELHQLYLDTAAKGSGVAPALMARALETARATGAERIYLSVFIDNLRAQAFYRKYGFVEIGKNPFIVGNTVDDDRIWRAML